MQLPNGSSYEGDFKNGEMTGNGLRRWADGTTYSGSFKLGEMCGQGVWVSPSGEQYDGQFLNNRRHGQGDLTLADGTVYTGAFVDHKFHGKGAITYGDNFYSSKKDTRTSQEQGTLQYEGNFNNGEIDGAGHMIYKDQSRYLGKWVDGKREGPSEFFGKHGSKFKYKGNYTNGSPTQAASGMKVINISDEWTPADEDEVKALPINEKWRAACAIEVPRVEEEESDEDSENSDKKPKAEFQPAFIIPDGIQVQIIDNDSGECASCESGRLVKYEIYPIIENDAEEKDYNDRIGDEPISFYLNESTNKKKAKYVEKKSISGFVDENNSITINGLTLSHDCDDGEYVIVVTDTDNQTNFGDQMDPYKSLPIFYAVHLFAGVSNAKAKKKSGGKAKKKKKKR